MFVCITNHYPVLSFLIPVLYACSNSVCVAWIHVEGRVWVISLTDIDQTSMKALKCKTLRRIHMQALHHALNSKCQGPSIATG